MEAKVPVQVKQYYIAVGSRDVKLPTLVDLLEALQANGPFGLLVLCGARDTLDELVCGLARLSRTAVTYLVADMPEEARGAAVERFARDVDSAQRPAPAPGGRADDGTGAESARGPPGGIHSAAPPLAHVLVATDAAVRGVDAALPAGLALLVSYDCPTRKDVYLRRLALLGRKQGARIAVHMAVAGEAAAFRGVEAFSGAAPIDVLPVLTSDIFECSASA